MTATTATDAAPVTCHKCQGRKVIAAHRRVQGGVCFTCQGTGLVSAADAARAERAAKARATRARNAAAKAAAAIEAKEAAALATYGDDWRLVVALAQFDHPHVHQASSLYCEMRDGGSDDYRDRLMAKMPALIDTLGLTGWTLDEIVARGEELRAARLAK